MEDETLLERTMEEMRRNIDRLKNGGLNCLPYPFPRSQMFFPGIERASYYGVMANTKVGKSQFVNYVFVFKPLMDLYYGGKDFDLRVLYFPLEETPVRVMQRFMSWLLYVESDGKVRVSPSQLRSTLEECPKDAQEMLKDEHIQDILQFFDEHVIFPDESPNPTGIYNYCVKYAEEHGKTFYREKVIIDDLGMEKTIKLFDHYEPDDPNMFTIVLIDPLNRIDKERGMDERESMKKMSEYCYKYLRNDYFMTPVVVQQQTFSSYSLDAKRVNSFEPTLGDAGGSKEILQDMNAAIALYNPSDFNVESYGGYDIKKLGKHGRFVRYLANRDGEGGGITPLFFDGAVTQFYELPKVNESGPITSVYNYCSQLHLQHTNEELANLNPFIKRHEVPKQPKEPTFFNLLFSPWIS